MPHDPQERGLPVPRFLTTPDPRQPVGITPPPVRMIPAPLAPTDRQLTAAVLAFEHALPEGVARPSSADRIVAMRAALLAAFREF